MCEPDHVFGRPSVKFRKIQVLAVVSFWSYYLYRYLFFPSSHLPKATKTNRLKRQGQPSWAAISPSHLTPHIVSTQRLADGCTHIDISLCGSQLQQTRGSGMSRASLESLHAFIFQSNMGHDGTGCRLLDRNALAAQVVKRHGRVPFPVFILSSFNSIHKTITTPLLTYSIFSHSCYLDSILPSLCRALISFT